LKGLSRVMGNYHARFLGGKGAERPLLYPVIFRDKSRPLDVDTAKKAGAI